MSGPTRSLDSSSTSASDEYLSLGLQNPVVNVGGFVRGPGQVARLAHPESGSEFSHTARRKRKRNHRTSDLEEQEDENRSAIAPRKIIHPSHYSTGPSLLSALGQFYKTASNTTFLGTYHVLNTPEISDKERIQTVVNEIWRVTGWRFTVKDHPRAKNGHTTRLWCSQDSQRKGTGRNRSTSAMNGSNAKPRYPCRSRLLISSRDAEEKGYKVVTVRMYHYVHHPCEPITVMLTATESTSPTVSLNPHPLPPAFPHPHLHPGPSSTYLIPVHSVLSNPSITIGELQTRLLPPSSYSTPAPVIDTDKDKGATSKYSTHSTTLHPNRSFSQRSRFTHSFPPNAFPNIRGVELEEGEGEGELEHLPTSTVHSNSHSHPSLSLPPHLRPRPPHSPEDDEDGDEDDGQEEACPDPSESLSHSRSRVRNRKREVHFRMRRYIRTLRDFCDVLERQLDRVDREGDGDEFEDQGDGDGDGDGDQAREGEDRLIDERLLRIVDGLEVEGFGYEKIKEKIRKLGELELGDGQCIHLQ